MMRRNRRIIDLSILEQNMRLIRSSVPASAKVMAVVKADGYGHGAFEVSCTAIRGGAEMLAVASVSEGKELRRKGITVPILVLGAVTESDVAEGVFYNLTQTICSPEMVRMCERAADAYNKQTEVHLKIDTGMGRIGIRSEEEKKSILAALDKAPHVNLTGAFTHFADADGNKEGIEYTKRQYEEFVHLTDGLPRDIIRHCCNSAAIHRFPEMALDMVRAGISLYGYPPVHTDLSLKPCMSWSAVISHIKEIDPGSFVSYGRTWSSRDKARIATITCGYGDGYHRAAGPGAFVIIAGKKTKIIGRICMDQMMADITDIDDVSVGDEAILIGQSGEETITAEDIASWAGTISYEVLLSSGSRVERTYINNGGMMWDENQDWRR